MTDISKLLNFLEQELVETSNNKRLIKERVLFDLMTGLDPQINQAIDAVNIYRTKQYWESKDTRIEYIYKFTNEALVLHVLCAVARLDRVTPIQGVCAEIAGYLDYEDIFDGIKTGAELLGVIECTGLYTIIRPKYSDTGSMQIENHIELEPETYEFIHNCMFIPPSIVRPKHISKNGQGGYQTYDEHVLLGKSKRHNKEVCLNVINIQNSVPLCLDLYIHGLEEKPNKPLETTQSNEQFHRLKNESTEVYEHLLNAGNTFYLTHKYDGRGRLYAIGYHVNYQSFDYKRALINIDVVHKIQGI